MINGQPRNPIEIHLNDCGIEVRDSEQNDKKMRQLRITHLSGLPVVLVLTLPELSAINIGRALAGARLLIASDPLD